MMIAALVSRRTLALRTWLILTVGMLVALIALAEVGLSVGMGAWQLQADSARIATVRRAIGIDPAQWRDPAWQQRAGATLASLHVEAEVMRRAAGASTQLVYATAGARDLLSAGSPVGTGVAASPGQPAAEGQPGAAPTFQKVLITGAGGRSLGAVYLWLTGPAPGSPSPWLWPLAAAVAVVLVLAIAIWLLGRAVLRPLAAMSRAAEAIAGGELDVHLPPSSAREVAEVSAALEGMSGALRRALAEQQALDEERQRLDEERRLFIGAIAHDLRTPLFMLRGYLKGLETGVAATPEKMAHYVSACRARADALERLIADLFAYTRLEVLEQEPARAPLELGAILREAADGVQQVAGSKEITLDLDAPAEPCHLSGDGQMLARVADNLLSNALRYAPHGGRVGVRWRRDGATLVFEVADNGPGIAAHDLPHLFTPLYRGESSRNRDTGGVGLGLAIARRIMQAHGGDLMAANGAGGGAVFTATLPASRGESGHTRLNGSTDAMIGESATHERDVGKAVTTATASHEME